MAPGLHCSNEGCANGTVKGGVCAMHGARTKRKRCSHEGCPNGAVKGGICVTYGARRRKVAATRGAPTEPSRGAFASCTARELNVNVAATRGAPNECRRVVFASRTARRLNVAATRGAPKKCRREDPVAGTARILSPPPPRTERHGPPILPEDTTPGPLLRVPLLEGVAGKSKSRAICKLTEAAPLLLDRPPFVRLSWPRTSLMTTRK